MTIQVSTSHTNLKLFCVDWSVNRCWSNSICRLSNNAVSNSKQYSVDLSTHFRIVNYRCGTGIFHWKETIKSQAMMTAGRCVYHGVQSWGVVCGWRKEGLVPAMPGQLTSSDPSRMNVPHCHGLIDPNEAKWWTARSALQMSVHRIKRAATLAANGTHKCQSTASREQLLSPAMERTTPGNPPLSGSTLCLASAVTSTHTI